MKKAASRKKKSYRIDRKDIIITPCQAGLYKVEVSRGPGFPRSSSMGFNVKAQTDEEALVEAMERLKLTRIPEE